MRKVPPMTQDIAGVSLSYREAVHKVRRFPEL